MLVATLGLSVPAATTYATVLDLAHDVQLAEEATSVAGCESSHRTIVWGDDGEAFGRWQVHARWWGRVPRTLRGQAQQMIEIVREHGWRYWSCKPAAYGNGGNAP